MLLPGTPGSGPRVGPHKRPQAAIGSQSSAQETSGASASKEEKPFRRMWMQQFWAIFDVIYKILAMGMFASLIGVSWVIYSKINEIQTTIANVNMISTEAAKTLPAVMMDGAKVATMASETLTNATQHTGAWFDGIDGVFKTTAQFTPEVAQKFIDNGLKIVLKVSGMNVTELFDHVDSLLEVFNGFAVGARERRKFTIEIPMP